MQGLRISPTTLEQQGAQEIAVGTAAAVGVQIAIMEAVKNSVVLPKG